jgi:predicted DNA-binding transcriptional regulator YafY
VVRQWRLLRRLETASEGLSVAELCREEGGAPRNTYRHLEALQAAGFPIYNSIEDGRSRWRLTESYRARGGVPVALADLLALRCARSALESLQGTSFHEGLSALTAKLDAMLTPEMREFARQMDEVFVGDRFGRPLYGESAPQMECLNRAAAAQETVELRHISQRGEETVRQVDPYNIWLHRGALYLVGWCHLREAVRTFALARVRDVRPTGKRFEPHPDYNFEQFAAERFRIWGEGRVTRVRIWFAPDAALYISERRWHPSQVIEPAPDGGIVLTMEVDGLSEVCAWVMGFGPRARVLEPQELVERVRGELGAALQQYRAGEGE